MAFKQLLTKITNPSVFILIGALSRLLPHPANFAPIGAIALFAGSQMNKKEALALPLGAMIISDIFIGFDSLAMRLSVYGSFLLIVSIGFWLKNKLNIKHLIFASLSASMLFFIITNFAVWAFTGMYRETLSGLYSCYLAAIPFFRNTILGDLFYSGTFFGLYSYLKTLSQLKKIKPVHGNDFIT